MMNWRSEVDEITIWFTLGLSSRMEKFLSQKLVGNIGEKEIDYRGLISCRRSGAQPPAFYPHKRPLEIVEFAICLSIWVSEVVGYSDYHSRRWAVLRTAPSAF